MAEKYGSFKDFGKVYGSEPKAAPQQTQQQNRPQAQQAPQTPQIKADYMAADCDYVKIAEDNMLALRTQDRMGRFGFGNLTTSKIRNILTLVSEIYNVVVLLKDKELPGDIVNKIRHLKVRLAYEAGREKDVKNFVEKTKLLAGIDEIKGDRTKFIRFARYLEALVAYHRFYGGQD